MDEHIEKLRDARLHAAKLRHDKAALDIDGAILKAGLEEALVKGGMAVTPAEKAAGRDPQYVEHRRKVADAELRLAEAEADAECQRIRVLFTLAEAQAEALTGGES